VRRAAAAGLVVLGLCGFARAGENDAPAPPKKTANWIEYGEALSRATTEDKHVLVDFYTQWCGWCKVMDRQTYADPRVVELLNTNFLIARIDAESAKKLQVGDAQLSGRELAQQFGVQSFPMTWFLKPDGSKLGNVPGFQKPDPFIRLLEYVHERRYVEEEAPKKNQ
jgi:thioredoxin-related protein